MITLLFLSALCLGYWRGRTDANNLHFSIRREENDYNAARRKAHIQACQDYETQRRQALPHPGDRGDNSLSLTRAA